MRFAPRWCEVFPRQVQAVAGSAALGDEHPAGELAEPRFLVEPVECVPVEVEDFLSLAGPLFGQQGLAAGGGFPIDVPLAFARLPGADAAEVVARHAQAIARLAGGREGRRQRAGALGPRVDVVVLAQHDAAARGEKAQRVDGADVDGAFGKKAKDGSLTMDDMKGGTFTISNGGVFGGLMSTPIINPPQSAVLGLHRIEDRPVVRDGQIVIRPMMYLALSYDHRLIDGREAVTALKTIKEAIEDPTRLLIDL